MEYRELGRTGWRISTISFGAWAIGGGEWGKTDDEESVRALHRAADLGVNFIDTADVYGDGHSERLVARFRRERSEPIIVATKAGRRLRPHVAGGYNRANITAFVERSLRNLGTEALDLLQLHCPPTPVYETPDVFSILDDLQQAGKIRHYGVSVERAQEAVLAAEYPNVQSVQIIFNIFRTKPEQFFPIARAKRIGILARVPLASGLLTGKLRSDSIFCRNRPSQLQPARRIVRRWRNVLRRRLRYRAARGRRVARRRSGWDDDGAGGAALDFDVSRDHRCHPGRAHAAAGRRQRASRRPTAASRFVHVSGTRCLQPKHSGADP